MSDSKYNSSIQCEHLRLIFSNSRPAILINFLVASILTILIFRDNHDTILLYWYAIFVLVAVLRWLLSSRYLELPQEVRRERKWSRLLLLSVFASGTVWGFGAVLMDPEHNRNLEMLVLMSLTGLTGGALVAMSALRIVYLMFLVPVLLPYIIFHVLSTTHYAPEMSGLLFFYMFAMIFMSHQNYKFIKKSILIRYEKDAVYNILTKAYADLEKTNAMLEHLSQHDALTGIHNRRWFDEYLDAEWLRAKRSRQPLSVLLIDVDYFKLYNDHYGHVKGDECLQRVAAVMNKEIRRSSDALARFGGEEFVVILPNTDAMGAAEIAEHMRNAVYELSVPHAGSEIYGVVTVSIGCATQIPAVDERVDPLITRADTALYVAKGAGRNRVSCSSE